MSNAAIYQLEPVPTVLPLNKSVYRAITKAILNMDIYAQGVSLRLDERKLADSLGVSRTPVREAISRLEYEGVVNTHPRHGTFVVKKNKREILGLVHVWTGLQTVAARLAAERATDEQIELLRRQFAACVSGSGFRAKIDEFSETDIQFHKRLIELSRCNLIDKLTSGFFIQMQAIRKSVNGKGDCVVMLAIDHMRIIRALQQRDAEMAERLVFDYGMNLAKHIEQHGTCLD